MGATCLWCGIGFILGSSTSFLLIYYYLYKSMEEVKKSLQEDRVSITDNLLRVEKKIERRTSELTGIRSSFKTFQAKFLEFDEKVDKLFKS